MNKSEYVVDIINTFEKLTKLKNDWDRIYNLRQEISIFFSFEMLLIYYETIIKNFKNVKIEIFIIRNRNNKIVAIFPFTYEIKKYFHFLSIKELSLKDEYLFAFYNFLVDPGENNIFIFQQFIEHLKNREWDIIKIQSIPSNEKLFNVFSQITKRYYSTEGNVTSTLIIDCDRDFDDYINNDMTTKNLRELRRKQARLKEKGELKYIEIEKEQDIESMLHNFYHIEDKNWKGNAGTSLKKSYYGYFFKKIAQNLSKQGKFKLFFLLLNNEYIAGIYAIVDRGICYLLKAGYVDDYFQYSPSKILIHLITKNLCKRNEIKLIDFHGPYYPYQRFFGKQTRKKFNYIIFNNTARAHTYRIILRILKYFTYRFFQKTY
jgi:hypothetical protein